MATSDNFSASTDFLPAQRERVSSNLSMTQASAANEDGGTTATNGVVSDNATVAGATDAPSQVQAVLNSEIGIMTLLNRLKTSIGTAKEFANFLKKRAQLEEDHSNGLRKLSKMTADTMTHPDHNQGSFGLAYREMMEIHEKLANNGYQFAMSLHQMHEDLLELAAVAEKNRKGWKQNGLAAEQRVAEVEIMMKKSKAKYDQLAEEYDRARTGDTTRRGGFGIRGPKSAAQYEEDLLRKVQSADQDYHGKVQAYQAERRELLQSTRPEAVRALQDTVKECDGGVVLQVQKFAAFNEKLLLSNGLSISPLKNAGNAEQRSLRGIVTAIDNDKDLHEYLSGYYGKLPPRSGEPKYERHPVLNLAMSQPSFAQPPQMHGQQQPSPMGHSPVGQPGGGLPPLQNPPSMSSRYSDTAHSPQNQSPMSQSFAPPMMPAAQRPSSGHSHERSFSHSSAISQSQPSMAPPQQYPMRNSAQAAVPSSRFNSSLSSSQPAPPLMQTPPQLAALSFQNAPPQQQPQHQLPSPQQQQQQQSQQAMYPPHMPPQQQQRQPQLPQQPQPQAQSPQIPQAPMPLMQDGPNSRPGSSGMPQNRTSGPAQPAPARPVFGVSLERLYVRDSLAVPMIVYQCIQAINLYGLGVEGIYRLSGSVPHVNKLKGMFDTATDSRSPALDFRNPENFFHDVNSVAGLLKQFLRDLPDSLFTKKNYTAFIDAAKNDDDTIRRDSLHAIINALPDPNYATLRALCFHLHKVMENSAVNRMNSNNLAIVFGPTLMGTAAGVGANIADASWQVRAVDTVLQNTYQIFDEE